MSIFKPKMYKQNIYEINYDKLKKMGIVCLVFDLDNTLSKIDEDKPSTKLVKFISELKESFDVYVLSNNTSQKRVGGFCEALGVDYVKGALKPSSYGLAKIAKKKLYSKEEMAIIGDQIMTDVLAGNIYGIETVLVEALAVKDLKVTVVNRFFEKLVLKRLSKKKQFKKGDYYD